MKTNFRLMNLILLVLMSVTTAKSQLNFGLKAGINTSTQSDLGNLYDNIDLRAGLSIGGTVRYQFSNNTGVLFEVDYVQKGRKVNSINSSNSKQDNNCAYITIPLILQTSTLLDGKNSRVYLEAGTYYGYMANNKYTNKDETTIVKEFYNNDFGLVFGGGVSKQIKDLNLIIGLRYEMGLMKVYKADRELRNKTLSLSVGYNF